MNTAKTTQHVNVHLEKEATKDNLITELSKLRRLRYQPKRRVKDPIKARILAMKNKFFGNKVKGSLSEEKDLEQADEKLQMEKENEDIQAENSIMTEDTTGNSEENSESGEDSPISVEDNPIVEKENPINEKENTVVEDENPVIGVENPVLAEENLVFEEENPQLVTENPPAFQERESVEVTTRDLFENVDEEPVTPAPMELTTNINVLNDEDLLLGKHFYQK